MIVDFAGVHLAGGTGYAVAAFAAWGVLCLANKVRTWFTDRIEWDRPSWRPWTWRAYRRWFGLGQIVATEDFDEGEVLDIDFWPTTWVQVEVGEGTGVPDRAVWLPLEDLMPAYDSPYDTDSEVIRDGVTVAH